jgi:hypothetical protein
MHKSFSSDWTIPPLQATPTGELININKCVEEEDKYHAQCTD